MNQQTKPLKKGDQVEILPEFQDPGDSEFTWVVVDGEHLDRVVISPIGTNLRIAPTYTVERSWLKLK